MNAFLQRLNEGITLVSDGATGTNLQQVGLLAGMHTEAWVVEYPDRIQSLEEAFVHAGSDIILTCTFGGSEPRLASSKYAGQVAQINAAAAQLARKAASKGNGVLVAGSMGPLGQLLKPLGPLTTEEATRIYADQAAGLASGGVDLLVIETQFAMDEALAAVNGSQSVTDLPIVVSFSYDRGTRTMMGLRPREALTRFADLGIAAIGANCGTTLENMQLVIDEYASANLSLPIWYKPNAGLPRMENGATKYDVTPDQMGEAALQAVQSGAKIVGGCCGSTPAHIAGIAKHVRVK